MDQVLIEITLLAVIIVGSIYLEQWAHDRSHLKEEKQTKKRILLFIADDLLKRLDFIKETYQYNDYKPFFTDMWDAVILTGKQALLPLVYLVNTRIFVNYGMDRCEPGFFLLIYEIYHYRHCVMLPFRLFYPILRSCHVNISVLIVSV